MDVIKALESRHSTRTYKPIQVDNETIEKIMEAAKWTPSWANTQPWEVYVAMGEPLERMRKRNLENFKDNIEFKPDLPFARDWPDAHKARSAEMGAEHLRVLGIERDDKEGRAKMTENNLNFFGAPALIVLCMDKDLPEWSRYDIGSFSQSVMLTAQDCGLNTIPAIMQMGYADVIREELNIPEQFKIVIGIALGYGDMTTLESTFSTKRRPVADFLKIIDK